MDDLIKEHLEKFGVKPNIIGMFWDDPKAVIDGISDAIDEGKPYDEYAKLSEDDQKEYDKGKLFF
jgi:hypothetical protein